MVFRSQLSDIAGTKIDPKYYTIRVGDKKLGTIEDTIEVIASGEGIKFPTGVTNAYFANSADTSGGKIYKILEDPAKRSPAIAFSPINTDSFKTFDYTSSFALAEKDPIQFMKYNRETILELVIKAMVDKNNSRTYKLNATLSK